MGYRWQELYIDESLESATLNDFSGNIRQHITLPPDSITVEYYWNARSGYVSLSELLKCYKDSVLRTKKMKTEYRRT